MTGPLQDQTVLVVGRGRHPGPLADLELAPIRVNAISPGVVDTGAWDALGEQGKADYFADITARNAVQRIGTPDNIARRRCSR